MKNHGILMTVLVTVVGCASMDKAEMVSIVLPNKSQGWVIDCSYRQTSACFLAAGEACKNGYLIHERTIEKNIDSKIPIDELPKAAIMQQQHNYPFSSEQYMIISCRK